MAESEVSGKRPKTRVSTWGHYDTLSCMSGSDRKKHVDEAVVRHGYTTARFFTIFVDGFVGTMKAKIIDSVLAFLVLIYQVSAHQFSIEAWRTNAWAAGTPWVWLVCGIAIFHMLRTAAVLTREISAESSLIEIPGRSRAEYPPQMPHFRGKIWGGSAVGILFLLMLSCFVYSYGHLGSAQYSSANKPHRPAPPVITSVVGWTEVPFDYTEKTLVTSDAITPCTLKHRKLYSFDELSSQPGGQDLKSPWLVAKPLRVLFENRNIQNNPQLSTPLDSVDLLFEISVTSRGEPTVAKDWMLCLVHEGKPFYYKPLDILPSDLAPYGNKTVLEQATAAAPIERGHLVAGWILFRVLKVVIQEGFSGGLEYRDYLEKRYSTGFEPSAITH